jgi:RNA polymerase sigma-70 factor (ECF subfamily)
VSEAEVVQVLLQEQGRLCAAVRLVVRDHAATEDVYQEIVLQALRTRDHFREPGHVVAWAMTTARHRAVDVLRARRAVCLDDELLDQLEQDWLARPREAVADRVAALNRCVEKLPADARALLRLRYADGLTGRALATRLNRSKAAVFQSLSRLQRALRKCVETELAGGPTP